MTPKEAFNNAVKKAVNGNKEHGWGVDDSCAVIAAIWESETGDKIDDGVMACIKEVVNPSQFRQRLETAKVLNKSTSTRSKTLSVLDAEYLTK